MKYKKLGRTDIDVSLICLGTMTWGRQNTEAEGHEQMDYALDQGVNFFDTAEMYAVPTSAQTYGKTEEIIGTWFASSGRRDEVILASKVAGSGLPWVRGGNAKLDRKNILEAIEASLKRLQTDYIDLYQLHWPNREEYHFNNHWDFDPANTNPDAEKENFLEVLRTLGDLVQVGKVRHAGLSNETAWGTMQYLNLARDHNLPRMVSIQNEYNLLNRDFDLDMAEVALHEDVGLLAWSPLATGMLSGKYLDNQRPNGTRWQVAGSKNYRDTDHAQDAVRAYMDLAKRFDMDVCQMALAFVNGRSYVTSNIIGATTMEQLKTNIESVNIDLSDDLLREIKVIYKKYTRPY